MRREQAIAEGCTFQGRLDCAAEFEKRASARKGAMNRVLWNDSLGAFDDYDWERQTLRHAVSAASASSLFFKVATAEQAASTAKMLEDELLVKGGLLATDKTTGEQWDAPNSFAALQWIAIEGLSTYGYHDLAFTIAENWVGTVSTIYEETGRLVEKYNIVDMKLGGGGGYPLQDGQGWTASVTSAMVKLYPQLEPLRLVTPPENADRSD